MNTKQVLQAAYDLIGDKRRWTQGQFARDVSGSSVPPNDPRAVCWCGGGAIMKVSRDNDMAWTALQYACSFKYKENIVGVNDEQGYAAIRRMFRKAIKEVS